MQKMKKSAMGQTLLHRTVHHKSKCAASNLCPNTIICWQDIIFKIVLHVITHHLSLTLSNKKKEKKKKNHVKLTCLNWSFAWSVYVCVCEWPSCMSGMDQVWYSACVIPLTHLTGGTEGLQQGWQCVTKCPPWTCLNEADCSNEAGQTRQSTCGQGEEKAMEEAGLDMSVFPGRGKGDFVLELKDGKPGTDPTMAGRWKTGSIVPWFGF